MLRKNHLQCGRIAARLFLALHQKSSVFKCKQFCAAKPMFSHLPVGTTPLYPANAEPQYKDSDTQ